jgi:hypothetical protein
MERHFARTFNGNNSPVTTHATGPHELATVLIVSIIRACLRPTTDWQLTEEDVDAHESDGGLLRCEVGNASYRPGDGYDELADGHADGSHE